jgi:hypothetical protein
MLDMRALSPLQSLQHRGDREDHSPSKVSPSEAPEAAGHFCNCCNETWVRSLALDRLQGFHGLASESVLHQCRAAWSETVSSGGRSAVNPPAAPARARP